MADDTLEERLRRVEDVLEIHQLCNDYGRYLDSRDFAAFATLFARDGEILLGPVARAAGPEGIRHAMERAVGGPPGESLHIIGTPSVQLDGDTATTEVMWTVLHRQEDGTPALTMVGRHLDDLVREDGRWRIKRRRGYVDIPSALPTGGAA
jgi:uncharacterized protein (TIGR02246 family)